MPFHERNPQQVRNRMGYVLIRSVYQKPTPSVIFNTQIPIVFPLKLRTSPSCPLLLLSFNRNVLLEMWATKIRKRKKPKGWKFSSVQSLSCVWLFVTPWTAARQASLSITDSQRLPKLMSIELVMPSSHLILCRPLLLPPSIFPSIRVISNESVLRIRWPKFWSFSLSISPSNDYSGLISFRMDWMDQFKGLSRVFSNTTVQKHQFFGTQLSL